MPSPGAAAAVAGQHGLAVRIEGISKTFGATQALQDVTIEARSGTFHALAGGNGSGKSTLIKILAGVVAADSGTIRVSDQDYDARAFTPSAAHNARFRFVHQQDSTFPDLTVTENLAIGSGFTRGPMGPIRWGATRQQAREVLTRFQVPADPEDRVGDLSRATQTMVAIARALQNTDPSERSVLVLDEPTAALPAREVDLLLDALMAHTRLGHTVLYVTHRLEEVSRVADQVTVLRSGAVAGVLDRSDISRDSVVELMIGTRLAAVEDTQALPAPKGHVVLDVRGLAGGKVRSAEFSLHAGEILGIAGLLGSGRSSMLRMLAGVAPRTSGTIRVDERSVEIRQPADARSIGIAYVPEDRREAAFESLSVLENISMPSLSEYWGKGRLQFGLERRDAETASHAFSVVAESIDSPLASLSGGNQQKALLARWLRRRPRVILLDEPTQGVDVSTRQEIYTLLRDAVREGAGAIVVTSEYEELEALCDRVLILRDGRILGEVDRATVRGRSLPELEHVAKLPTDSTT